MNRKNIIFALFLKPDFNCIILDVSNKGIGDYYKEFQVELLVFDLNRNIINVKDAYYTNLSEDFYKNNINYEGVNIKILNEYEIL